ncbi:F-box-like domain-containing protein [Microdochium nivale]|nr:F-box-like domain-containing protein [Microdochium nivale]
MDNVLAIPELLETILVNLDTRTLLVAAQRVNRTWRSSIRDSPTLQKALFFRPDHSASLSAPVFNKLLVVAFPFCFTQLWQAPDAPAPLQVTSRSTDTSTLGAAPFPASTQITSRADAFSRTEASWRRMLIQQPPLRSYGVVMTATIPSLTAQAHGNNNNGTRDQSPAAATVQEILLMPSPTLCATTTKQRGASHDDDGGEGNDVMTISMSDLLAKCLAGPHQKSSPQSTPQAAAPVSGFRILWPNGNSSMDAVAEVTYPDEQVRGAVMRHARAQQDGGMVFNPVIGLAKMSTVDANLQRVRDILLGGVGAVAGEADEEKVGTKPARRESGVSVDLEI